MSCAAYLPLSSVRAFTAHRRYYSLFLLLPPDQVRSLVPQSCFQDRRQISRGKFHDLRRTTAGFTPSVFDGYALRCHLPARPTPYASSGSCSSAPVSSLRFLQTFRRRNALALCYPSPPSGWDGDFHPASRQTCSASGRREPRGSRPPTPPYVRFRIRRFIKYSGAFAVDLAATAVRSDQSRTLGRPRSCARLRHSTRDLAHSWLTSPLYLCPVRASSYPLRARICVSIAARLRTLVSGVSSYPAPRRSPSPLPAGSSSSSLSATVLVPPRFAAQCCAHVPASGSPAAFPSAVSPSCPPPSAAALGATSFSRPGKFSLPAAPLPPFYHSPSSPTFISNRNRFSRNFVIGSFPRSPALRLLTYTLQSSAYRQNLCPRLSSSLSSSSSRMFDSNGDSGPPCGVPSLR